MAEQELDVAALARERLLPYVIAQKANYKPGKHHILLAMYMEAFYSGKIKRLMIFMPPRYGKSEMVTKMSPAWAMGKHPELDLVVTAYGQDLADEFGRATKNYMNSHVQQVVFPDFRIDPSSDAIARFHTTKGGAYNAVGVGGALTGKGGHRILIDDPYKNREQADSEAYNKNLIEFYESVLYTRLQTDMSLGPKGRGGICLVQTRWNKRDLAQYLLDKAKDDPNSEQWVVLNLAAICEDENDPLKRKIGEALWPEFQDVEELRKIKIAVGARNWNSLYQQNPSDALGTIFLRENWKFYSKLPEGIDALPVQSWDMTFKKKEDTDFVVGLIGVRHKANLYLKDRWKKRASFTETVEAMRYMNAKHPDTLAKYVEDKANGPAIIDTLTGEISGLIPVEPKGSKEARWWAASPLQAAGNVFLPEGADWVDDFVDSCAAVPQGKHDDDADAFAQMVIMLFTGGSVDALIDVYKEMALEAGIDVDKLLENPNAKFEREFNEAYGPLEVN